MKAKLAGREPKMVMLRAEKRPRNRFLERSLKGCGAKQKFKLRHQDAVFQVILKELGKDIQIRFS